MTETKPFDGNEPVAVEPASDVATESSVEEGRPFDARTRLLQAFEEGTGKMDLEYENRVRNEVLEWLRGEFKDNMRTIVDAQQDICGQEKNHDACANGRRIFEEMFNEPYEVQQTA